jgi:hypothetical protein
LNRPREYDQDRDAVVVDDVLLLACGDERGVSRRESAVSPSASRVASPAKAT